GSETMADAPPGSLEGHGLDASVARNLSRLARPAHRGDRPTVFSVARSGSRQSHCPVRPAVVPCSSLLLPSAPRASRLFLSPRLPLPRRRGSRRNAARRLLDPLQPQLPRLPPQRLDLLLLHPGLVLLLTPASVRHPGLQRQVDDPGQLVRRRRQG